jgi:uncharacterized protein
MRAQTDISDPVVRPRHQGGTTPLRLAVFLVATLTLTWIAFLPFILGDTNPESAAGTLLLVLGIGAPSITAFALSGITEGRGGLSRLWRQGTRWRVGVRWYLVVFAVPALAFGAAWAVSVVLGVELRFGPLIPALISGLLAGLLEEYGWSGYAFPKLHERYGFVAAGATVGVIVAIWHLPFFLIPWTTQAASSFPMFLGTLVAARIVFGWVYLGTAGSVLLTVLLHAWGNASGEVVGLGPIASDAPGFTLMLVFIAAAVVVILQHRKHSHKPSARSGGLGE